MGEGPWIHCGQLERRFVRLASVERKSGVPECHPFGASGVDHLDACGRRQRAKPRRYSRCAAAYHRLAAEARLRAGHAAGAAGRSGAPQPSLADFPAHLAGAPTRSLPLCNIAAHLAESPTKSAPLCNIAAHLDDSPTESVPLCNIDAHLDCRRTQTRLLCNISAHLADWPIQSAPLCNFTAHLARSLSKSLPLCNIAAHLADQPTQSPPLCNIAARQSVAICAESLKAPRRELLCRLRLNARPKIVHFVTGVNPS
jgi:hypothetical protein